MFRPLGAKPLMPRHFPAPSAVKKSRRSGYPERPSWRLALLVLGCAVLPLPLPAADLVTIKGGVFVEADLNDGDSFIVNAAGRELHLRLYYVDCLETVYSSKADLKRMQEQQHHFGLKDLPTVRDFGERAAERTRQILSRPFTIHTSYANALGRSATGRIYAFVETHDGADLAHVLVAEGLARIHGKTRPAPDGTPSETVLQKLQDLRDEAMRKGDGIWRETDPELRIRWRAEKRKKDEQIKEWRDSLSKTCSSTDEPINLNTASSKQLQRIPGIGPVRAKQIIAGRPYQKVEDLLKISGIGPKTLEKIKPCAVLE